MVEYQQTKKHKKGLTANAVTPSITSIYKKTEPSQKEYELAVQEGILEYHTMIHNHSYRSMDCATQLTMKFSCTWTKGEATVKNMFAPWATNMVTQDLDQVEFVSLSIDSSNNVHVKLLPKMVRYCKANDGSMSVETKLLHFVELKGEMAK